MDSTENEQTTIRVFLLDDHEIVRVGVAELINAEPDLEVVGQAGSASDALAAIEACSPDVAILDVRLGDGNGIEVCREIRSAFPDIFALMLTSFTDDRALVDAAMAGASGFVLKQIHGNEIISSVRAVAGGAQLLDPATVRMGLARLQETDEGRVEELTPQERRIFDLIGDGYSNRQIADEMFLAEKTVKNYVSNLLSKLGMVRRTEAAAIAARIDERKKNSYDQP